MKPAGTTRVSFLQRLADRSDELSWGEFHDRYGQLLFRYARRCGASLDVAEDIVQEVEMYLFRAMKGFQYRPGKGRFRAYLRLSVVRAMGRHVRKRIRGETPTDPQILEALAEGDDPADEHWDREWRAHCLRWAFRSIVGEFAPVTLEAFRLHALSGCSVTETSKHLGISEASVYQAKSRVLKRLKERIDSLGPDGDPWSK